MQFVEDYSEPQPSMFYQTPQNEHIYQQKNKHLREVYGINDSFISLEPSQDLAPPPALPPKQRQLVSDTRGALPSRAQQPGGSSSGFAAPPPDRLWLWEDGCLIGVTHPVFLDILLTRFQAFCIICFELLCSFLNPAFRLFPVSSQSPEMP